MPKNIEDMIVPEKKKSIRDIPIPEGRRKSINILNDLPERRAKSVSAPEPEPTVEYRGPVRNEPELPRIEVPNYSGSGESFREFAPTKSTGGRSRKKVLLTSVAGFVVLAFVVLSVFSGATLAYVPKSVALNFSGDTYTAYKTGEGELLFSVVKLSGDKGMQVEATGEEEVTRKASGTIVVYNDATPEPQKLVKTTRFETPDGKIYRIQEDISVPGKKGGQPGSLEVMVYADVAGEAGNTGLTDFTLPGLKGSARYTTIYARSKTAMTGGLVGKAKTVSKESLANARQTLEVELKGDLLNQVRAQVPPDFILFPSLSSVTYEDLPQSNPTDSNVTVNLRGNLNAVMFKRSDLAGFLASKKGTVVPGEAVEIPELDSLGISFAGPVPADLLKSDQISIKLDGTTLLVWRSDEDALKASIAGRKKGEIATILVNYPSVARAEAMLRPFWKSSFPKDPSKIKTKKLSTLE